MRTLALDVGSKTIGVAVSDPMGWTAQGIKTIRRRNEVADEQAIKDLVRELEIRQILVGLPINMNGSEGAQAARMRKFAKRLEAKFSLPVILWDERLSSVAAEEFLVQVDLSRSKRHEVIDKMAAVLILQDYLGAERRKKK